MLEFENAKIRRYESLRIRKTQKSELNDLRTLKIIRIREIVNAENSEALGFKDTQIRKSKLIREL